MADEDEIYDPILLTLTGAIVTWWGRIEALMFHDLLTLQHDDAVKASGVCNPLPMGTRPLVKAWIKATAIFETEEKWQRELEHVASELRECSEDRHVLVHGFWDYPDPAKSDRTQITVLKPGKKGSSGKLLFAQYKIDVAKLHEVEARFRRLYHRLLPFSLNHGFRLGPKIFPRSSVGRTPADEER